MARAIQQLRRDGADAFILDLRNNPGGLVRASMEVASLWLPGAARPTLFNVEQRNDAEAEAGGGAAAAAALHAVVLEGGRALASEPLVVLVNRNSASGGWGREVRVGARTRGGGGAWGV